MEPASALSTYCRTCGGHIRISQGSPPSGRRGIGGLMDMMRGKTAPVPPARPQQAPRAPAVPLQITGYGEQDAPLVARAESISTRPAQQQASRDRPRQIQCYDCGAVHRVSGAATSTLCPGCSTYIDLRDIEIKERTNQRVRTRGDVVVHKKGALFGTTLHCGNLTVYGTVAGSIYASGDVLLKADGKIIGEIRCRRLELERKCEVQCLQPVHAEEVEIFGTITGHFHATKTVALRRNAALTGSVTARRLIVEPGAVLNGQMLVQPEPVKEEAAAQAG